MKKNGGAFGMEKGVVELELVCQSTPIDMSYASETEMIQAQENTREI